jgi:polyhydroxyalkanoate synthase
LPRAVSDAAGANVIARKNAAQQRGRLPFNRGPHPLPLFWQLASAEIGDDPARMAQLLAAVSRYQSAPRPQRRRAKVAVEDGAARLLQYGSRGTPVVLVPSLVNPPWILDLDQERSLAGRLAGAGFATHLVDWGTPGNAERSHDLSAYVRQLERLVAPLGRPVLVGYCIGGALAMAAAARGTGRALATIATPWDFDGYPTSRRAELSAFWRRTQPIAGSLGVVPMSLIQPAFWALDPGAPVRKFASYAAMDAESAAARRFEAMEDWANGGAPLTLPALREALEDLFGENLTGRGQWSVGGITIQPQAIDMDWVNFISATDRIVPAAAAPKSPNDHMVQAGHVGMVAGSRAEDLLVAPLVEWLRSL